MPDLPLWPQCNIACVFCSNPVEGYRDTTEHYGFEQIKKKLEEFKLGMRTFVKFDEVRDYFNLTGGEPTAHPDFLKIVAHIRLEFPQNLIRLLSNGRMFYYEDFARQTLGIAGLPFEAAIPMFGGDAKSHESISRTPQSFEQTVQGLHHIFKHREPGQLVEIRIILTKIQLRHLDGLLDFLHREFGSEIDRLAFLFVELEGFAERYREALTVPMSDCAARLDQNFDKLSRFKDFRLLHFPLCVLPTRLWPFVWNTLASFKTTYLDGCRTSCGYKDQCVGVHRSYEKHAGAAGIMPITEKKDAVLSRNPYHPFLALEEVLW